ncbi:MAG: hypothetical protein ABI648_17565 [Betaproteobacteria bacterium]
MTKQDTPRILAVADRPGWAIDNKTQNLQCALAGRFEIVKRFQHEVTAADLDAADIVLIYFWLQLLKIPLPESALIQCAHRLIMGICSHFSLCAERREPGLAVLRRPPVRSLRQQSQGDQGCARNRADCRLDDTSWKPRCAGPWFSRLPAQPMRISPGRRARRSRDGRKKRVSTPFGV